MSETSGNQLRRAVVNLQNTIGVDAITDGGGWTPFLPLLGFDHQRLFARPYQPGDMTIGYANTWQTDGDGERNGEGTVMLVTTHANRTVTEAHYNVDWDDDVRLQENHHEPDPWGPGTEALERLAREIGAPLAGFGAYAVRGSIITDYVHEPDHEPGTLPGIKLPEDWAAGLITVVETSVAFRDVSALVTHLRSPE